MVVLFTRSSLPVSWLIRKITGEDCSHVAILQDGHVIHCDFTGVHLVTLEEFTKHSQIVHEAKLDQSIDMKAVYEKHRHAWYDFGALSYLGLRYLFPFLPKANLWQTTGMYICSEFVTEVVTGHEDSMITPYGLYCELTQNK